MSNEKSIQAALYGHFPVCLKVILPWSLYDYRYGKAMNEKQPLKFPRRFSFHTVESTVQQNPKDMGTMRMTQPRLRPSYAKAQSLYVCTDENNYVEGMGSDGITISNEECTALHLDGCVFRNVFSEDCEFDAIDTTNTVLENYELLSLHFNKGAIHRCVFRNCRCMGIDSSDYVIHNTFLTNLKAAYANLSGLEFRQVILENSNLPNASFIQCEYQKTVYDGCDLKEGKFHNTSLKGMGLPSSDIEGINLTMDYIRGAIVSEQRVLCLIQLLDIIIKE